MDKDRLMKAFKIGDQNARNQLEQFWNDEKKHVLGLRLDSQGRIKSVFRIENLESFVANLETDSDLVVIKTSSHPQPEVIRWVTDHEAVEHIRKQFVNLDGNIKVLELYDQIQRFIDRPTVLQDLTQERTKLMEIILEWSDNLLDIESDQEFVKNDQHFGPLDRIASKVILLKKREKKLSEMLLSSTELFSDLLQHSNYRSNLQETAEMLQKESQQLFTLWQRESNSTVEIGVLNRSCIEFRDEMPNITLTEAMVSIVEGSQKLADFGMKVDSQSAIARLQNGITPLLFQVKILQSVVDFYNRIGSEIRPCHASLLLQHANNFTQLLESARIKAVRWNDGPERIRAWIGSLQNSMQSLVQQNDNILRQHNEMIGILAQSFDEIDASNSLKQWIDVKFPHSLSRIKTCNEEIKLFFPSTKDTFSWRKHIDYQIYKVVRYALLNVSNRTFQNISGIHNMSNHKDSNHQFVVNLQLDTQGNVSYEPSIEAIKYRYLKMLNSLISLPTNITGLVDWAREADFQNGQTLFYAFYLSGDSKTLLKRFYSKFNELSNELIQIKQPFLIWSCLYLLIQRIKTELYEGRHEDNGGQIKTLKLQALEEYRSVLEQIRAIGQQFTAKFEIVNELQSTTWPELTVNIVPLKMLIKWLIGESKSVILQTLIQQITVQAKKVEQICSENLKRFHDIPNTLDALVDSELYLANQLPNIYSELRIEIVSLREKIKFAESYQQAVSIEQTVNALYNEFENFCVQSEDLKQELRDDIQKIIVEEKKRIEADVDDFLGRWANLGDLLKSAPEIVSSFVTNAEQLSSQIEPLKKARNHLEPKQNISLFANYDKFMNVCDEIQHLNGKYGVLREFESKLSSFLKAEWIVSRNKLGLVESQLNEWSTKHTNSTGSQVIMSYLESWKYFLEAVQICKGESYSAQHWSMLLSILELDDCPFEQIKTEELYRKRERLMDSQESIKELTKMSQRDRYIEDTFRELEKIDQVSRFNLGNYATKDGKNIQIVKNWQEAMDISTDVSLLISSLQEISQDTNQQTQAKVQEWENRLALLQLLLSNFNRVQRKWISLEPIFSVPSGNSSTNRDSFTTEREMFTKNSTDFKRLLNQVIIENRARIFAITYADLKLEQRLDSLEKQFGLIQKRLRNMMESARQRFARFYFISDEDLLLILSGKVDLNESGLVQKLFSNTISKFIYDGPTKVIAVQSIQGEILTLRSGVDIPKESNSTGIEAGLSKLSLEIEATLLNEFQTNYNQMEQVFSPEFWCRISSQLLSLYSWLEFTNKVEYAIPRNSLVSLESEYEKHLKQFTSRENKLELQRKFEQFGSNNNAMLFDIRIRQTVLDLIHFLQVIDRLKQYSVTSVEDWQWQQELRFYSSSSNSGVLVKMGVATIEYSFLHYLGAFGESKLVHTELTNRCFLTMTQAAALGLGANPYGPAGTGKTETVKALGVHLGREVLVFNCDEAIDTRSMIRILLGIVQCGAWACFDEFNRLQLDVLSVLSTLIGTLQDALKSGKTKITLPPGLSEVSTININHRSAIFITLNPVAKQYGARNELPDNLKALFLPISMTVPDLKDIISFLFVAQGFSRTIAGVLSTKVCLIFDFASGSLSKQRHYDWGLRAMKTCVLAVGKQFQDNMKREQQFVIAAQTLRQQIRPKLVEYDVEQFEMLLSSVFGSNQTEADSKSELKLEIIQEAIKELALISDQKMIQKVNELYSQLKTRFGVVLFGPTGSGKTTVWKLLKKTLEMSTNEKIKVIIISPKAVVPRTHLFGVVESETRDWIDGLFTSNARTVATNSQTTWFIFDGEIDPEWVEALNSVLDDNHVLTLASGERINFDTNRCNILFECSSLRHASPATISRLGVICFPTNTAILEYIFPNEDVKQIVQQQTITMDSVHRVFSNVRTLKVCEKSFNVQALYGELVSTEMPKEDFESSDDYSNMIELGNGIVETSNMSALKKRLETIVENETNIKLIIYGPKGCGKWCLLEAIIFSQTTSTVILYNCTAKSDTKQLMQALLKAGSLKRTKGGHQCLYFATDSGSWLVIKTWELLHRDKWNGNSVEAFILFLVSHNGFYHYETHEWIEVECLNIAITCNESFDIDARIQSRFHLLRMSSLSNNDIAKIITIKATNYHREDLSFRLPAKLMEYSKLVKRSSNEPFSFLNMSLLVLKNLSIIHNLDDNIIDYEIMRIFGQSTSEKEVFLLEDDDDCAYRKIKTEDINERIMDTIQRSDYQNTLRDFAITGSVVELFQTLTFFFRSGATSSERFDVETMILIGNRGFQRKTVCTVLAENFGYQVWTAKNVQNERQLVNDLKQLFSAETGNDKKDRKIVLFLDQVYLECLHFLGSHIIEICRPNEIISGSKTNMFCSFLPELPSMTLRIVISKDQIDNEDHSVWLRNNAFHCVLSRPREIDYKAISDNILKEHASFHERLFQIFMFFSEKKSNTASYREDNQTNMIMFSTYVRTFVKLYDEYCLKMKNECQRLESGVASLDRVGDAVSILKNETFENKTLLDVKQKDADEAFEMIVVSMQSSEDKREELEKLQVKIATETDELRKQKQKVDDELAQIEPLLEKAKESVGSIKNEALSEVRSLRAPPVVIRDILEGVLRLLGVKDTSWNSMKNYLSRKGISQIVNFDPSQVSQSALDQVDQLLATRGSSFEMSNAKRASIAAASLAEWVTANIRYVKVVSKVKPFQLELQRLETKLNSAQIRLKTLGFEMQGVDTQVQSLRDRMQRHTVEAAQIEINLNKSNKILDASEVLVTRLSSEHGRWRQKLNKIQQDLSALGRKLAISVAYSFFAPMCQQQKLRLKLWNDALDKFIPEGLFKLGDIFDKTEISVFLELQNSERTVLVHDPHNKVLETINVPFKECSFEDKDCYRQIELAQRLGKVLVIKNAEPVHFQHAKTLELLFGLHAEKNANHKLLILVNDIGSFVEQPSLLSLTQQIYLGGSFETIVETLLTKILQIAAPKLQQDIDETEKTIKDHQKLLQSLENDLLECLADQTKDGSAIVQDENLIEKLGKLKESASSIESAIEHSKNKLEQDLQINAAKFRDTAYLASQMFKIIESLTVYSNIYHVGFAEYEDLFERILQQNMISNKKIDDATLIQAIFENISKSLFPAHQRALAKLINNQFPEVYPSTPKYDINMFLKDNPDGTLLIITAKGENVVSDINRFVGSSMIYISLGNSSIQNTEALFRQSSSQTKTVCLANLHLVSEWLTTLAQLLKIPRKFNVILITEMCEHLPRTLLEQCIKYVHHSANETNSGSRVPTLKSSEISDLLEFVHWIITERRLYVPIGWSKQYEFGNAEKLFAQHLLELIHRKLVGIVKQDSHMRSWLAGLLGNVIYGAKLDQKQDHLVLEQILERCLYRPSSQTGHSYLNELELPENVSRIRTRSIQEELTRNFNVLLRIYNEKTETVQAEGQRDSQESVSKFSHGYFKALWKKILQKCKVIIMEDMSLDFNKGILKYENGFTEKSGRFALQEIQQNELSACKVLMQTIHQDLYSQKETTISQQASVLKSLQINETPTSWNDIWQFGSIIAQEFLIDLAKVYRKLTSPSENWNEINLKACFDPCSVFRRIQQQAAGILNICLDELSFDCDWTGRQRQSPPTSSSSNATIIISGIAIEGAIYDQRSDEIVPVTVDSPVLNPMPSLVLRFRHKDSLESNKNERKLELSLFTESSRQTIITTRVTVFCQPNMKAKYVERNVALILESFE